MEIVFTKHAKDQMKDRKILEIWVEETIKSPDKTEREGEKYYIIKKLNGKILKVVYLKKRYIKVLTTFFIT
ncbi:MAG: DUF4258 domain-containing protein [Candidatus Woesearchaeota archaeon]|nr:MAG: DUF4258 domain-containing protein [Candidatus Woesearchaeota archaeon]